MKKCHFCHEERPDDKLSMKTRPIVVNGSKTGEETCLYCNDRRYCQQKAMEWWLE